MVLYKDLLVVMTASAYVLSQHLSINAYLLFRLQRSQYFCFASVIVDKSELKFKLDISHINQLDASEVSCYIIGFSNNILTEPIAEKLERRGALHGEDFSQTESTLQQ